MDTLPVPYTLPDLKDILSGQLTANTLKVYGEDVAQYVRFAVARGLSQFDPQTLRLWRDQLVQETSLSPNTINRMLSAVRRVTKEAATRQMIASEVAYAFHNVESVSTKALKARLKQHSRTRISPDDMRRLTEAPDTTTLVGKRDRALLHCLATSGMRITEAVTLQIDQIEQRELHFFLKVTGKTDTTPRDTYLSAEAYLAIQLWIEARPVPSPYVFTRFEGRGEEEHTRLTALPLTRQGAWKMIQRYAESCGIAHLKPHDFRRFLGTTLTKIDIRKAQKALGHADIGTTAAHYVLDELEGGLTDHLY